MNSIQEQYKELYENFQSVVDHLRTVYEGDDPDNYLDQLQCQLDKARPVSDESDTTEDVIWASGHFLTIPFPLNFRHFSDEELNEYIDNHSTESTEGYEPEDVVEMIDDLAWSMRAYNNGFRFWKEEVSNE
ncbi:MAG: hypothetical protein CMC15_13795 [Flavobacteriaceae bacterium]|nr:hypothetical protein [Flavobacteriaceae bacterium]